MSSEEPCPQAAPAAPQPLLPGTPGWPSLLPPGAYTLLKRATFSLQKSLRWRAMTLLGA